MNTGTRQTRTTLGDQRGFSLVELMIASVIGLILMAAMMRVVVSTNSNHREVMRSGQLLENGRYAMHLLTDEIEHAGFLDQFDTIDPPSGTPTACAKTVLALQSDIGMPIQGLDAQSASFSLPSCVDAAAHRAGTDILIIRRASTTPTALADLVPTEVYVQGRYDDLAMDLGQNPASFDLDNPMITDPAADPSLPIRKYRVDIYFISPCSEYAGGSCQDSIPTLKRMELGAGPDYSMVSLVEGIEDLQLYFGVDSLPAGAPDGAPDRNASGEIYIAEPGDPATASGRQAWANVMGVQLYLLTRDIEQTPGHQDDKSYVLSPAELATPHQVAGNDTPFKRQVFSSFVRVINPSSRREG